VMHVEIRNRDALQTVMHQGMRRADRDIIENAESHGTGALGMVTGWADVTKNIFDFFPHDQIHTQHHGSSSTQRSLITERIQRGVSVEMHDALWWHTGLNRIYISRVMHAQQLLVCRRRRIMMLQVVQQPGRNQLIFDSVDACRRFRMMRAHVVFETERMADIGGLHGKGNGWLRCYHT